MSWMSHLQTPVFSCSNETHFVNIKYFGRIFQRQTFTRRPVKRDEMPWIYSYLRHSRQTAAPMLFFASFPFFSFPSQKGSADWLVFLPSFCAHSLEGNVWKRPRLLGRTWLTLTHKKQSRKRLKPESKESNNIFLYYPKNPYSYIH